MCIFKKELNIDSKLISFDSFHKFESLKPFNLQQ